MFVYIRLYRQAGKLNDGGNLKLIAELEMLQQSMTI